VDGDGRISLAELRRLIRSESYTRDIPEHTVKQIMKRAEEDETGYLDYSEFLKMVCNDFMECLTLQWPSGQQAL
jgi:rhomboid-related protein 1/2/3